MKATRMLPILLALSLIGGAAAAQSGMDHSRMGGMDQRMMQPTPANPYPAAEMKMHHAMMNAVGTDATETWVRKMIEHHRGGIEMSQIVVRETRDARVRQMATKTIAEQRREIGELQAWLRTHRKRVQ